MHPDVSLICSSANMQRTAQRGSKHLLKLVATIKTDLLVWGWVLLLFLISVASQQLLEA